MHFMSPRIGQLISLVLPTLLTALALPSPAPALEHVEIVHNEERLKLSGRIEVEAEDGGLLLLTRDGVLWDIQPDQIKRRERDDEPFVPLTREELAAAILAELPAGFDVHHTARYIIVYNTTKAYAQWCGGLYERLYAGFDNYWTRRGLELKEPELPLVALVFDSQASYARYAESELGEATNSIIGYYSLRSNRVTMYDLTGTDALRRGPRVNSVTAINQLLAQPEAERTVATIIHEATHQLAFNRGLHQRYADIPLWLSEGFANFFETPDLQSARGWRNIGGVNQPRLQHFRKNLPRRPHNSLANLLASDDHFRDPRTGLDAYAEAWALNYYLIRQKPQQFAEYLKMLGEKKPLMYDEPEARLMQFRAAFGDLQQVEADFLRFMQRVK